ncbi:MAG TPA: hypothetical protein PLV68_12805, partial [Ilumatobacteraceae bacterium]|nr:hypothetical protein [Ilumatobacteraceae bacterium]
MRVDRATEADLGDMGDTADTDEPEAANETSTLQRSLDAVTDAIAAGRASADIAVLTRVNALLAPIQVGLMARGVAVRGGVGRDFAERTAVRAVLAWLRLAGATGDTLDAADLGEALKRPSRPLH